MKQQLTEKKIMTLTLAAVMAAAYVVLTYPFAIFTYGILQFRLAEAMSVLAVLTPAAIPGLFLGCLIANLINPGNLGPVDIILGSLATLISAILTWTMAHSSRLTALKPMIRRLILLMPAVVINALVVGTYLPFLLIEGAITPWIIISSILMIMLSQAVVIYAIGLPLLLALEKTPWGKRGQIKT